jgi:hypothetical protein
MTPVMSLNASRKVTLTLTLTLILPLAHTLLNIGR